MTRVKLCVFILSIALLGLSKAGVCGKKKNYGMSSTSSGCSTSDNENCRCGCMSSCSSSSSSSSACSSSDKRGCRGRDACSSSISTSSSSTCSTSDNANSGPPKPTYGYIEHEDKRMYRHKRHAYKKKDDENRCEGGKGGPDDERLTCKPEKKEYKGGKEKHHNPEKIGCPRRHRKKYPEKPGQVGPSPPDPDPTGIPVCGIEVLEIDETPGTKYDKGLVYGKVDEYKLKARPKYCYGKKRKNENHHEGGKGLADDEKLPCKPEKKEYKGGKEKPNYPSKKVCPRKLPQKYPGNQGQVDRTAPGPGIEVDDIDGAPGIIYGEGPVCGKGDGNKQKARPKPNKCKKVPSEY